MKWIFPAAIFVSSLLLLAAAHRAAPRQPAVAVVYRDTLLQADPVAHGLTRVQDGRDQLQTRRAQALSLASQNNTGLDRLVADDRSALDRGFRTSRNLYQDFLSATMEDTLDALYRGAREDFSQFAERRYQEMIAAFDAALAVLEQETLIEPLRAERRRLLNMRLVLGSLTRDRIALSPLRIEQLDSEIESLQSILESKKRMGRRAFTIKEKREYEQLESSSQQDLDARTKELDTQMQALISDMEQNTRDLISGYEAGQQSARSGALERRRAMLQAAGDMREDLPERNGALQDHTALDQYMELFDDTIRARAGAAATDSGAFLVLDTPLARTSGVKDVTAQLGLPVKRITGEKQ